MSLATIKQEIIELCPEEQERLADMLAALIASHDTKFVEEQSKILDTSKEWTSLDDFKKDLK
ncbi:MAG: hypothetical protein NE328_16865 [Lentisphaeraceae bacterium]|nr:hypothetical protein [Lentisphaeraceae bacterium]